MKNEIVRFWGKLAGLAVLVGGLQVGSRVVYTGDEDPSLVRIRELLSEPVDVLYLSDSVNFMIAPRDRDRRSISSMVNDFAGELKVAEVDHAAYHPRVFEALFEYIARQPKRPRAVVIPVNLRSFSPSWDRFPQYQFTEARREVAYGALWRAVESPLRTFHVLDEFREVSWQEYESTPVYFGSEQLGVVRDFDNPSYQRPTPENIRNKYVLEYMQPLSAEHRLLQSLRRIVERAGSLNVELVVFVTPIDVERGTQAVGPEFIRQVDANVGVLRDLLQGHTPSLLDLSHSLPAERFNYGSRYPNEHLNDEGRRFVARRVADVLIDRLGNPHRDD